MKEFIKQCLEDLEPLTGIRQLYFMQQDADGIRKIKVLIDGIILALEDYPYIPEEAKKKIIRDQMVKDQNYDALNSRVINKWMATFGSTYFNNWQKEQTQENHKPAPPEIADKYIAEFKANLEKIGGPKTTPQPYYERFPKSYSKEYLANKKKFIIEGVEILAESEEQAIEIYSKQ